MIEDLNTIDVPRTAAKIIQGHMWRNGYLIPFVTAWVENCLPDWSLTDIKDKDRNKYIVKVKSVDCMTKEVISD